MLYVLILPVVIVNGAPSLGPSPRPPPPKARFAEGLLSCAVKDWEVGQVEKVGGRGSGMGEEEVY